MSFYDRFRRHGKQDGRNSVDPPRNGVLWVPSDTKDLPFASTCYRVIVAQDFRHKGLGMVMMREFYLMALEKEVELLVTRILRPQIAARNICRKLGFREELLVPDYLHDLTGATQDMILMACEMKDFWKELEQAYLDSDWQKYR